MSKSTRLPDIDPYEQACDQAIAMCDGNLRSAIKILIMANEYLEGELRELQEASAAARPGPPVTRARLPRGRSQDPSVDSRTPTYARAAPAISTADPPATAASSATEAPPERPRTNALPGSPNASA